MTYLEDCTSSDDLIEEVMASWMGHCDYLVYCLDHDHRKAY